MGNDAKSFYKECKKNETNRKLFISDSQRAVLLIRKMQYFSTKKLFGTALSLYYYHRLITKYGICVHPDAIIGIGLSLPHPNGIVIGKSVVLGENVTIYHQVTIGSQNIGDYKKGLQPHIGDNCVLFSGAKILGNIDIGNNCIIGANSVMLKNSPPNSFWAGVPAKKIK